jgi:hypothetical protein
MTQFQLFDAVKLREPLLLAEGGTAAVDTPGAIVEVFNQGEAYMVELFGEWVKTDAEGQFIPVDPHEPGAFMETLGVETVAPQQICLVKPAQETVGARAKLLAILEVLPDALLEEVWEFAEFLQYKHQRS